MTRSLYAVLNVAPDADPAVIEAAYKALMKKYHPDVLTAAPSGDQQKASEINQAFQTLRDPERRARYDHDQRERQNAIRRAAMAAATPQIYQAPPAPSRRRRSWPALILLAAIAAAAWLWWRDPDSARDFLSAQVSVLAPAATAATGSSSAIQVKDIDGALDEYRKIKDKTGLLGLSAFSEDCFAGQSRAPTARAFDFCVAFDHAAARYGALIAGDDLPQLPRFRPDEIEIRHESAARLVSDDEKWIRARRAKLVELTTQRLQLAEPVRVAPPLPPPPATEAARQVAQRSARPIRPTYSARFRQPSRATRVRRADRDFLERQGYIY